MIKIYKGTIITCDKSNTIASYLVTQESRIVYVGDQLPQEYSKYDVIEIDDGAIVPAFVDSHIHFASFALFNSGLNVMEYTSNSAMLEAVGEYSAEGKILIAFGASAHSVDERVLLTRQQLDTVTGDKPCVIIKYDGHALIANSALIDILPEEVGSLRGYDANAGYMSQEAFFAITDYMTASISTIDLIKYMIKAVDDMAVRGIGMFHTVTGIGFPNDLDVTMETLFAKGIQHGMQSRVFFQTMDVAKVKKRKLPRIGGCFATALDGCFGSVDAALIEPYADTDSRGILYYDDQEVVDFCKRANGENLQIELHAIGDEAFRQATHAIAKALADYPRDDHRHCIIHACLPTKQGLDICQKNGIMLAMQSAFINWAQEPDEYLDTILGDRASLLNPVGTIHDMGIKISLGSDGPCTTPDPMLWIHNIVNHPVEGERTDVLEALKMATYNGVYNTFDEDMLGSIETGKLANIVLLGQNPVEIDSARLKDIQIKSLILNGREYRQQSKSIARLIAKAVFAPNKA